jgi:hypothetical protein
MSRAPAPIKIETPVVAPPYANLATYSMMPPQHAGVFAPGMHPASVATQLHPMQHMYSGMQLQQQLHQQQQQLVQQQMPMQHPMYTYAGVPAVTEQNVKVVDFKDGVVAEHYAQQLRQQHEMNAAALAASAVPAMGLVGHDGCYRPAVNATAYTPLPEYAPYPHNSTYCRDSCYDAYHPPGANSMSVGRGFSPLPGEPRERAMSSENGRDMRRPRHATETRSSLSALSQQPVHVQRQIVGDAVRDVLGAYRKSDHAQTSSDAARQLARERRAEERYYD